MNYAEFMAEEQRLVILRTLAEDPQYSVNSSILQTVLARFGFNVGRATVHALIGWLEEKALVTVDRVESVQVAKLTQRGLDVAKGREIEPGVKRPGPGA